MAVKKSKTSTFFNFTKENKRSFRERDRAHNEVINDSSDDLLLGNIPDLNEDTKKKMGIPKRIQIKKSFRLLKREKKLLDNLDSEKKEKVEHLLRVRKAVLKSKGEKVYVKKKKKKKKKKKRKEKKRKEKKRKEYNDVI
ncbi:hypothetical protein MKS88_002070 [Plasmodium brasilianum]|uniref:Uncharacterized protein n=1 Tax=Plasmodium brasilianum TaxID=5824 RepID=A0ACB9YBJ1_PLABR|nr:hypothetical protein MKS88_002070 [Plasmodium brasilianum]